MERTKNASRNIFFGGIYKALSLLIPFFLRTILIRTLGVEYIGLGSLFTSILQVLNLAELGISSAIVYSMYGAIATGDETQICQLMNLYKKIYRIVGLVILAAGCAVAPFLRFFISGTVPNGINIYVLYFVYLANTCLTYFLFAYKNCLFTAHQRSDVTSKVGIVIALSTNILQGILLVAFKNYYLYVIVLPLMTIINNIIISITANKVYPNYIAKGNVPGELKSDIRKKMSSLFLYKIGSIVLTSVDTIVISSFLGLTALGKYNNYYYIITALFGFLDVYYSSLTAGIGNSIKLETKEKNKKDFDRLFLMQGWIVSWCSVCLFCLYQPFMRIWVGEDLMFPFAVTVCMTVLFFVWKIMDVVNMFKNAAGIWEYDKWRPLVASIVNLVLNILLVNVVGIYGIIISTIVSIVLIIFPWSTFVLFRNYFNNGNYKKDFLKYIFKVFLYAVIAFIATLSTYSICNLIPEGNIGYFLLRMVICLIFPNIMILCATLFFNDFEDTKNWLFIWLKGLVKRK